MCRLRLEWATEMGLAGRLWTDGCARRPPTRPLVDSSLVELATWLHTHRQGLVDGVRALGVGWCGLDSADIRALDSVLPFGSNLRPSRLLFEGVSPSDQRRSQRLLGAFHLAPNR